MAPRSREGRILEAVAEFVVARDGVHIGRKPKDIEHAQQDNHPDGWIASLKPLKRRPGDIDTLRHLAGRDAAAHPGRAYPFAELLGAPLGSWEDRPSHLAHAP